MPNFIQIASVVPEIASLPPAVRSVVEDGYPDPSDDLFTASSLANAIEKIARAAPTLELRVVYDGLMEWFDLRAIGIRRGAVSG